LYPAPESRRSAERGPRCPAFKSKDSVLQRPNDEPAGFSTVCPGQHAFADGYSVVWWDPGALALGAKPPFGVRREDLIVKDVAPGVVADGRSRYDRWQLARIDARTAGALPSMAVATVREWTADQSHALPAGASAIAVISADVEGRSHAGTDRAGGAAFGVLVHAVLAQTPFDAPRDVLDTIARVEARILGLDETEAVAAAETVARVLQHDVLGRARAAAARGACRREAPVTCTLADGTLVEGVVDLAFEEGGGWIVVDYKTDREIAVAGEERYRRQLALYAAAVAQATGSQAAGILLRV
jgi:ATP-dependent exoDNAse (exonuclease V) beta subunit